MTEYTLEQLEQIREKLRSDLKSNNFSCPKEFELYATLQRHALKLDKLIAPLREQQKEAEFQAWLSDAISKEGI